MIRNLFSKFLTYRYTTIALNVFKTIEQVFLVNNLEMSKVHQTTVVGTSMADPLSKSYKTSMNLQFTDLSYEVMESRTSAKVILNRISGEFRAGELSAIMGPSGSGKTTLLKLLAGYRIYQTSGYIEVNEKKLQSKEFPKIFRFIAQDDDINPYFTAWETLMFASQFKLNSRYTQKERVAVVNTILDKFNLKDQAHTMILKLSGGERKKISIAMELLDEPTILVLDEPTTGLDEFSATQCVKYLHQLAAQSGCTIICSIHSPSARLLAMFDKIYALVDGMCIYQGTADNIVPYLEHFALNCPLNYNPGDFLIEVATHEYGNYIKEMVHKIRNGKIAKWLPDSDIEQISDITSDIKNQHKSDLNLKSRETDCSWLSEFKWILIRNLKQMWRDKMNLYLRVVTHILVSAVIGYTYSGIGNHGLFGFFNYYLCMVCMVKCMFMSASPMLSQVPQELHYLRREHFNQWYRLSSYFMALLMGQFLIIFVMSAICSAIIYTLTYQPMQLFRFLLFFGIIFLTTMMGSAYGIFIGSTFNKLNALFIGPNIIAVWTVFAHYTTSRDQLSMLEYIMVYSCCLRYSVEGLMVSLLSFNRSDLECPREQIFCLFSKPKLILRISGYSDINYLRAVGGIVGYYIIFALLAFWILNNRLSRSEWVKCRQCRYFKYLYRKFFHFKLF